MSTRPPSSNRPEDDKSLLHLMLGLAWQLMLLIGPAALLKMLPHALRPLTDPAPRGGGLPTMASVPSSLYRFRKS
ncbi:hypothetical protein V2K69_21495 [Pseudomonas alliivorans]|nr:hypothetical protein [Pseudomonas alliivorans]MEE4723870.1 hypothetical protein [Pseudomonas alliivorans]MEE4759927.1 hypothetical protein [Pseudomonas alliivorans]MEE4764786.1 hypothetical protein [Pseudomonas alliivorans]MEE4775115.1 hypothetical protein [Pseudomonas alliivorans]